MLTNFDIWVQYCSSISSEIICLPCGMANSIYLQTLCCDATIVDEGASSPDLRSNSYNYSRLISPTNVRGKCNLGEPTMCTIKLKLSKVHSSYIQVCISATNNLSVWHMRTFSSVLAASSLFHSSSSRYRYTGRSMLAMVCLN